MGMSSIIYETINLYNKERGILPYRYIGSDQHNKKDYFGSNKALLKDIKILGKHNFHKNILYQFDNIDNITLRKIESDLQKKINVAEDDSYYNKTNCSHKGYSETKEERELRVKKLKDNRENWWNNLSDSDKKQFIDKNANILRNYNLSMKGKTYEEIYGIEKAKLKKLNHMDSKNGMAKKVLDCKTNTIFKCIKDAINFYNFNQYKKPYRKIQEKIKLGELIYI
jgi:hypothetical protein